MNSERRTVTSNLNFGRDIINIHSKIIDWGAIYNFSEVHYSGPSINALPTFPSIGFSRTGLLDSVSLSTGFS